jgi:FMN reductase
VRVLVIDGSPQGGGRTAAAAGEVAGGAAALGAEPELISLGVDGGVEQALAAAEEADAFVIGSPMYRASFAHPLKTLLDALPRGFWGEQTAPITGRAVAIVGTGASWHHFLGLDGLRSVLAGFFAAHVVPPGLYVPREGFGEEGELLDPFAADAALVGRALVELARALEGSEALGRLRPQA